LAKIILPFIKAQALGNDFIMITRQDFNNFGREHIPYWADRRRGIGFDQLIIYDHHHPRQSYVWFYNSDGSTAEACGNGSRCLISYLLRDEQPGTKMELHTQNKVLVGEKIDDVYIKLSMGYPAFDWYNIPQASPSLETLLQPPGLVAAPTTVNIGNPHVVFFVEDLSQVPVAELGPLIEHHSLFPQRINVSFAQVIKADHIELRVWERGAGITQSCGSAACATAVAAIVHQFCDHEVVVNQPGGALRILWHPGNEILMIGAAEVVFAGALVVN
jgi:diaminopimelate epimerase